MKRFTTALAAVLAAATLTVAPVRAQQVTGAGSTFVYPVLAAWSDAYAKKTGVKINYQSIGSGGGIAQIKAGTVTFGASDMPLEPARLAEAGLIQFPLIIGAVVPVVNLPGIDTGKIRLSGKLLADIFLGTVKTWNDPALAALNPGLALPALPISVVHRSDGSGTTFNFVDYLAKVSPDWRAKIGVGTSVSWPAGVGGKGNEGVAAYVQRLKGSIGYVEYAYVLQNKIPYAVLENAAGSFVAPSARSFQEAAASADWSKAQDFDLVMTNAPGAGAYPITATVFILMHRQSKEPAQTKQALDFFRWALGQGQEVASKLDYVPLPEPLVAQIEAYWQASLH